MCSPSELCLNLRTYLHANRTVVLGAVLPTMMCILHSLTETKPTIVTVKEVLLPTNSDCENNNKMCKYLYQTIWMRAIYGAVGSHLRLCSCTILIPHTCINHISHSGTDPSPHHHKDDTLSSSICQKLWHICNTHQKPVMETCTHAFASS